MHGPSDADRAEDPLSSAELLEALSRHRSAVVRQNVAANPSVPPGLLLELLGSARSGEHRPFAEAVLDNASLPLWLLADPLWMRRLPPRIASAMLVSARMTPSLWTHLSGHLDSDVKLALLRSAHAPGDAWVRLGFDRLLHQPEWNHLAQADLAAELASAPSLTLESWQALRDNWIFKGPDAVRMRLWLLASRAAPPDAWAQLGLSGEGLRNQRLRPREMGILAKHLPPGTPRLDLSQNELGEAGMEVLAWWRGGDALAELRLGDDRIGDAGVETLAAAAFLRNLRSLDLQNIHTGPRGARALARSPHLTHLAELSLSTNQLGDAGVAALVEDTKLGSLRSLRLRGNQLSPAGVLALARSRVAGQLEQLDLSFNQVDDASLGELASACDCLADLDLSTTAVSVAGLLRLLGSTRLGALRDLRLGGPGMGDGQAALRQAARPGLRLHVG